jgi:hypothetical protein
MLMLFEACALDGLQWHRLPEILLGFQNALAYNIVDCNRTVHGLNYKLTNLGCNFFGHDKRNGLSIAKLLQTHARLS